MIANDIHDIWDCFAVEGTSHTEAPLSCCAETGELQHKGATCSGAQGRCRMGSGEVEVSRSLQVCLKSGSTPGLQGEALRTMFAARLLLSDAASRGFERQALLVLDISSTPYAAGVERSVSTLR